MHLVRWNRKPVRGFVAPAVSIRWYFQHEFCRKYFTLCETSLALAGFAGVVSAFAGRERSFRPVERLRLTGLMSLSAIVLAGSLTYIVASLSGLTEPSVLAITSLVCFLATAVMLGSKIPELWRRSRDSDATVARWSLYLVTGLFLASLLFYGAASFVSGGAWMIALGFTLQLLHGLWLFVLLLTRAN